MTVGAFTTIRIGQSIPLARVPDLSASDFHRTITNAVGGGQCVAAFFGHVSSTLGNVELYAVLSDAQHALLRIGKMTPDSDQFPSITLDCPQVHLFEREIAEQYGVRPAGHPWLKPVRFHSSYRPGHDAWNRKPDETPVIGVMNFYRVEGDEIHEVAVGPVHAGVIEPGHFRFQCHGEQVFHLEISLGYQHRGVERTLVGGPDKRTLHTLETVAGDTSIGHATAYSQAVESLAGCPVPLRADVLRGVVLELERLANHTGDLGRAGRRRRIFADGILLRPAAGRFPQPDGPVMRQPIRPRNAASRWCSASIWTSHGNKSVLRVSSRRIATWRTRPTCYGTRRLCRPGSKAQARCRRTPPSRWGWLVQRRGPAASNMTCARTCRRAFIDSRRVPVSTWTTGDVFARAYVRWLEIQRSVSFIREQLQGFPEGPIHVECGALKPEHIVVSLVEGWRGEICHVAITDVQGRFARYKIVDPSFHNWAGVAVALRDQQISDFPLCNKSFNLSYCGHDL